MKTFLFGSPCDARAGEHPRHKTSSLLPSQVVKQLLKGTAVVSALGGTAVLLGGSALAVRAFRKRKDFEGKVAVITGGSRGLGLAIARELAKEGARLHLLARDGEELGRAAEGLRERGASVDTWVCDVRQADEVNRVMGEVGAREGHIDLLVNNAGVILVGPFEKMAMEDFDNAMNTHFWAPLHTTRAALPYLKASRGRIVNIASIGGRVAVPHLAAYSASKFALVGLSEALRAELAKEKVSVTTVSPGLMRTGSHINAEFKGDHEKEFAWFSLGATLPGISIGAERAARQIVNAARKRRAELTITIQARAAEFAHTMAPGLFSGAMSVVNAVLPTSANGEDKRPGRECGSWITPSFLTVLGDRAGRRLNES